MGLFDEPKPRRRTIPKAVKMSVWNKYIGALNAEGKCYVCRKTIHISDFEAGHNKAKSKDGKDTPSNLRPICRGCNLSMGTQSIESYKAKYYSKPKKADDRIAELGIKVRKYISSLDYKIMPKRHGFDLCAKKDEWGDSYLVVWFALNKVVTATDVENFMGKTTKFYKTMADKSYFSSPKVQGLIAYTGELPKNITALARGSKPPVKFKKF